MCILEAYRQVLTCRFLYQWMPDSRNDNIDSENLNPGNDQDFPCIKCYSTIDAPMDKGMCWLDEKHSTHAMV
jgi:hypothetical protein